IKEYCEQNSIRTYEIDILPTERFLMERFINSQVEFTGEFSQKDNLRIFVNPQVRKCNAHISFSSLSVDIETGQNGSLYSIGLYFSKDSIVKSKVLMLADSTNPIDETLHFYGSEKEILVEFLKLVYKWDPNFIIGWHVIGFDLNFLQNKFIKHHLDFNLGQEHKRVNIEERKGIGHIANTPGRVILDGPPILRSAFFRFPNFKLDTVAHEVLGHGKDISNTDNKVAEIERRFRDDKLALAKYNILDCKLVTDIFNKLDIFNLLISRSKISGLLFDRLPVSTAAFDHVFLPKLHRKGYVAPNRIDIQREEASTGGMVIEPTQGRHKNVAVFDFKSLYPSIIMTFKIDPYSRVMSEWDTIYTPNKYEFSNTENILPSIIQELMHQRELAKHNNNASLSQAVKILMNSFYGVMGSSRCRFYHADLPSAVTTTGHWILKQTVEFFENNGLEVIYGDTDSLFVKFDQNEKSLEHYAKEVNLYLTKLIEAEFSIVSKLECEFEKIYDQIFFSQTRSGEGGAKKRYIGQTQGELDFVGVEFIRSDWTQLAKDFQKQLFERFFNDETLEHFIKEYINSLKAGLFDDLLVYTKRLSKPPNEYVKNIPVHVKAALKMQTPKFGRIKEVKYIMTKQGPEPIELNPQSIDYEHYIEKQLKPIANDILHSQNQSFDGFILGDQLSFL
ncbi:MAG: DNA polymerase II, partial [Halobacteriovoraceae bacterium]|nr:DNA polymerase II [Halobacteriovoraceae bacterium]